jgi:hypothetical protein
MIRTSIRTSGTMPVSQLFWGNSGTSWHKLGHVEAKPQIRTGTRCHKLGQTAPSRLGLGQTHLIGVSLSQLGGLQPELGDSRMTMHYTRRP